MSDSLESVEQTPSGISIKATNHAEIRLSDRTAWYLAMRILTEMRHKQEGKVAKSRG